MHFLQIMLTTQDWMQNWEIQGGLKTDFGTVQVSQAQNQDALQTPPREYVLDMSHWVEASGQAKDLLKQCIFWLVWKRLHVPQKQLVEVVAEREV